MSAQAPPPPQQQQMQFGVKIVCSRDGAQATIEKLYPLAEPNVPIKEEDVMAELAHHKVIVGIDQMAIVKAVGLAIRTGQAVHDVVIARATQGTPDKHCLADAYEPCAYSQWQTYHQVATWVSDAFAKSSFDQPPAGITLATKGKRILKAILGDTALDIFGRCRYASSSGKTALRAGENVRMAVENGDESFYAEADGYVAITRDGKLSAIPPLIVTQDKMGLDFIILPLASEMETEKLSELLLQNIRPGNEPMDHGHLRDYCRECHANGKSDVMRIAEGQKPGAGVPGRLEWHVNLSAKPPQDAGNNQINYAEISPYAEVDKNTVIAELLPPQPGEPGMDVLGNAIPAEMPPAAAGLETGENVSRKEEGGVVRYISQITGMARYSGSILSVLDTLVIRGHVGSETGNLHYTKNIMVEGDITAGYAVECGGDLSVSGSIENGAHITCGGNLSVYRGVFGQKTEVVVKKDSAIGFIQDSNLEIHGDLEVRDYIQDSEVYCRGTLTVIGKAMHGQRHGAVMGGHICAMGGIKLHSVGTPLSRTFLLCGVDERMLTKLKEAESLLSALTKRMMRLQNSLGFNPTSADAAQKLARLTQQRRQLVKAVLLELRQVAEEREKVSVIIPEIQKAALSENLDNISVIIERHIVPSVIIRIGNTQHILTKPAAGVEFRHEANAPIAEKAGDKK